MAESDLTGALSSSEAWKWLLIAILLNLAIGFSFRLVNHWSGPCRGAAWFIAFVAVALTPCLVPQNAIPLRFVAALVSTAVAVKLYDSFQQRSRVGELTPAAYAVYLVNWFWVVLSEVPAIVSKARDRSHLAVAIPSAIAAIALGLVIFRLDYANIPFLVEHCLKVSIIAIGLIPVANGLASLWRLVGGKALQPMGNLLTARTPAEFWRRWNRPAQQFFEFYWFRSIVGLRRPALGILTAFAISALAHEYLFGIAIGRVYGWQILYFVVNGLAVAATFRLRPRGWLALLFMSATLAFNLLASVIFFKSVDVVIPFYAVRN